MLNVRLLSHLSRWHPQIHQKSLLSWILKLQSSLLEKLSKEQLKKRFIHCMHFRFDIHSQTINLLCKSFCVLKKLLFGALQYDNWIKLCQGQSLPKNLIRHSKAISSITFIYTDTPNYIKRCRWNTFQGHFPKSASSEDAPPNQAVARANDYTLRNMIRSLVCLMSQGL